MQVAKWGNSLAVRLPASVVEALELKEGDQIEIQVVGGRAFEVQRQASNAELLERDVIAVNRFGIPGSIWF